MPVMFHPPLTADLQVLRGLRANEQDAARAPQRAMEVPGCAGLVLETPSEIPEIWGGETLSKPWVPALNPQKIVWGFSKRIEVAYEQRFFS